VEWAWSIAPRSTPQPRRCPGATPGKLGFDAPRKRFRKSLALAKLNHPNIGTVYDLDNQDGIDFPSWNTFPAKRSVNARQSTCRKRIDFNQLADCCCARGTHEHGIVHQDLKPGNIMVTPKGQS
jgi:serine/threonine protein kinase